MANIATVYNSTAETPRYDAWVDRYHAVLQPGDRAAYANFISDEGPHRAYDAYSSNTWDRLRQIKAQYDPTNLSHRNQNVPPAGAVA